MNSTSRELLRNTILIQLDFYGSRNGLPLATLLNGARTAGFPVDEKEVEKELDYCVDKELADECQKTLSPENKRWRITATGRDYLATQGLA